MLFGRHVSKATVTVLCGRASVRLEAQAEEKLQIPNSKFQRSSKLQRRIIARESSVILCFSAARGWNVDCNCGVSSRAAEKQKKGWVWGAFYKQATPN